MATTWVMAGESSRAKIFILHARRQLEEVQSLVHPASRLHDTALHSDRPGRAFDSAGQGRHGLGGTGSGTQHERAKFAAELADYLNAARAGNAFGELILVAPPTFLGTLRPLLDDETRKCVSREIGKNLVREGESALLQHLSEG